MTEKELSTLTDQELLDEAKKTNRNPITNAVLIGVMIGIVIYGIAKNSWSFFALIPLFFAIKIFNNSKKKKALEELLKERNLN